MNQKNLIPFFIVMIVCFLLEISVLDARGGGGHGGGDRGGGKSLQRSPSMSRASHPAAARQAVSTRPVSQPAGAIHQQRLGEGKPPLDSRTEGRAQIRNEAQNFLKEQSRASPVERAVQGTATLPASRSSGRSARSLAERRDFGQNVRREIGSDRLNRGDWFNGNFWDRHNYYPSYWTSHRNWWGWASAASVADWLGWYGNPVYYDYSDNDDDSWSSSTNSGSTQVYSNPTQPAESNATQGSDSSEWMPLGVFALSKEGEGALAPNIFMQLAVNRQGMISGTFYNATLDQPYELEGKVDNRSQRATWKVVGSENAPFIEAGIYNLTQSEVPARVYFPNGTTQQMLLIRLEGQK